MKDRLAFLMPPALLVSVSIAASVALIPSERELALIHFKAKEIDAGAAPDLQEMAAADPGVTFVNLRFAEDKRLLARDGFHPGPPAHSAWAARVAEVIRRC